MNKPFFSIIIPTYNPKVFLPTILKSITHNKCLDKIEVVISDDCSTEAFEDVLKEFPSLTFNTVVNDKHYGFPRWGRQHGAEVANGLWLCFADQDDFFIDNAFDKLYEGITANGLKNYIISDFYEERDGRRVLRKGRSGWTHGKFYEKSFWDEQELKYDEIQHCEDIDLSNKVDCILTVKDIKAYELSTPIYVWKRRKDSLSEVDYLLKSMPDYIHATQGVFLRYIKEYLYDKNVMEALNIKFITGLYHVFFYYQSETLSSSRTEMLKAIQTLQPYFTEYKSLTGFTNEDLIQLTRGELMGYYQETRTNDFFQIPFVEHISFADWLYMYLD